MSLDSAVSTAAPSPTMGHAPIIVQPCASEVPLKIALTICGVLLWVLIVISMIGLLYSVFLGIFFFVVHTIMIANIRGSSIKLGPQQMPRLYDRVAQLSERVGLKKVPDAYLLQSGGILNAFATRFGSRNFVVLHSDMVQACGNNMDALDFIIAHELGHLHRGHLSWRWLKAPALAIPFLGTAYYRSCEYTCDRYGAAACAETNNRSSALCLLAAGAHYAPVISHSDFVAQTNDLNSALMLVGGWFASHPPLSRRVAALDPSLRPAKQNTALSTVGAVVVAMLIVIVPLAGFAGILAAPLIAAGAGLRTAHQVELNADKARQENGEAMKKTLEELGDEAAPPSNVEGVPTEAPDSPPKDDAAPK